MKTQIPIYRARKIDSDEDVVGFLQQDAFGFYVISYYLLPIGYGSVKIDPSTLAIHFPDMIDSEGTKIFASLSEDGKGGDIAKSIATMNDHSQKGAIHNATIKFRNGNCYYEGATLFPFNVTSVIKVTGIQE